MFDLLSDILSALSKNKLRTALTGFSMAWGIFMLVALLGCGNGLLNAMMLNFSDKSTNVVMLWPGRTSMPYNGLESGRRIILDDDFIAAMKKKFPGEIGRVSPNAEVWGVVETYQNEFTSGGGLLGITPTYMELSDFVLSKGRTINYLDQKFQRKVVIMHQSNVDVLFRDKDPIGEYIIVNNVPYQVIGVYKSTGMGQNNPDVIPLSTMMQVYATKRGYDEIKMELLGITNMEKGKEFDDRLQEAMAQHLNFDKKDHSGVWQWNVSESYFETQSIFNGINFFLWLITIGTLIAGVVGISNIMLVTVKERTKEFGIRKSLGARPSSIMKLILTESLLITLSFGYLGLLAGVLLLEGLCKAFPMPEPGADGFNAATFVNPSIDFGVAIAAIVILVIAGLAAAYIPAKKAVVVKPVEAMHYE